MDTSDSERNRPVPLSLHLISFGHKYGMPDRADLVLDVRMLPNPHWIPELKPFPGTNPEVAAYVLENPQTAALLAVLLPYLDFVIASHRADGREALTIATGCTGGKHRSVAVTEALARHLASQVETITVTHRDIDRE